MNREHLRDLATAAIENATALGKEAALLGSHGHYARAYFLAVASIEETGKAVLAHDAQGRNLANQAVALRVERLIGDHKAKIRGAFMGFLRNNPREQIDTAVNLMLALQNGREPSMYTDMTANGSISVPSATVESRHALSCIRLANDCLLSAKANVLALAPELRSTAEDEVFSLRPKESKDLMNSGDFWWYFIHRAESGNKNFHEAAVAYRNEYLQQGKSFRSPE